MFSFFKKKPACKACETRKKNFQGKKDIPRSKEIKVLKFEDIKLELEKKIENLANNAGINEQTALVNAFTYVPFCKELTNSVLIGGPTIPMIMLLGKSGRIYYFALKSLIDVDLKS